ncbi:hypothetical protein B0A75_14095 [Flavobacterium oncorhynchi]|uniref:Uncharacterized protein n=1 Tax=Flavobacterium oncorhynchi TaxID=728056 RepID=A0A226HWG7_9FLAO|nr:hypothetical protein [Flavobacterium oncorhynchi]OXA98575.1 hypothetical protein B0A75_14095 [Flavobacterium oncorhynchi]
MAPNNFEKDFRDKLNHRKIEPSNKAWDRLDAMLSVAEEEKTTVLPRSKKDSKRKWLFIAASIVGFLLVGTFFFNQKEALVETPKNNVVIEENVEKDPIVQPVLNAIDSVKQEVVVSEKESLEKKEILKDKYLEVSSQKSNKNKSNQVAESSIIIKNNQEKQSKTNQTAIADTTKKESVDQLLDSAEKTILAENSAKPKSKVKVNAADLLNQVDGELELSFREKVVTKVNKNYQSVKVALANRNQKE